MIYLNNAATSYPKPACVLQAHAQALAALPQSQFRDPSEAGSPFQSCRESIAALLHIPEPSRIFFASGSTEALNTLLRGIAAEGGSIAATETEHNSVLRPLANLTGEYTLLPCDQNGYVEPSGIANLPENTSAVFVNHCSNVTGTIQDIAAIAGAAHDRGMLLIADVSQSAGCVPVDVAAWRADAVAFTGHKAMLGPQGTGGFYLREGLSFAPMIFGGTGYDSERLVYGKNDYSYEAGTQNAPGIAALDAGVRYVLERGVENIAKEEGLLTRRLRGGLEKIQGVSLFGPTNGGPVVSFHIAGISPADAAYILYGTYGIILRSGLQCTPLIHKRIGAGKHGVIRASISPFTTAAEIEALLAAVTEIAEGNTAYEDRRQG